MNLFNSVQEICFKSSIITIAATAIVIIDDLKNISVIVIIDDLKHISVIVIIDDLKHISTIVLAQIFLFVFAQIFYRYKHTSIDQQIPIKPCNR